MHRIVTVITKQHQIAPVQRYIRIMNVLRRQMYFMVNDVLSFYWTVTAFTDPESGFRIGSGCFDPGSGVIERLCKCPCHITSPIKKHSRDESANLKNKFSIIIFNNAIIDCKKEVIIMLKNNANPHGSSVKSPNTSVKHGSVGNGFTKPDHASTPRPTPKPSSPNK